MKTPKKDYSSAILFAIALALFALVVLASLTACSSARVVERHTTTDTLRIVQRDTLWQLRTLRDSVFLKENIYTRGDTVFRDRFHYRDRAVRDTLWKFKTDVQYRVKEKAVIKEVERKPTWRDRIADFFNLLLTGLAFFLGRKSAKWF